MQSYNFKWWKESEDVWNYKLTETFATEYRSLEAAEQAREIENKDKTNSGMKTLNDNVQKVTAFGINHPTTRKIIQVVTEMVHLDNRNECTIHTCNCKL